MIMSIDFTARKRAETTLRETMQAAEDSKAQYELIVSMISDIVWRYDVNAIGEHVGSYISSVADKMLGLPDGTIGNSVDKYFSYVHPDDLPTVQEIHSEVIRTLGKDKTAEYRLRKADGTTLWVRSKGSAYSQADGRVIVFGTTSDITEQKQAEKKLEESKDFLNKIIDSIGDPIFVKDRQHHLILVNDAACKLFGSSREDIIGRTAYDLFPEKEMADISWENDEEVFRTGVENVNEETNTYAPGVTCTVLVKKTLYRDEAGKEFLVGVTRDITERKLAEELLRKEKEFADGLIHIAHAIILVLDTHGRIAMINPYVEEISGYRTEEVRGKDWFETFLPESNRQRIRELFSRAISDTMTKSNINPIVAKDGRKIIVEWHNKTLIDPSGNVTGLLCIGQDITERMRVEEEARSLKTQIEFILGATKTGLNIINAEFNIRYIDPTWQKVYGDPTGRKCYDYFMGRDNPCHGCGVVKSLQTRSLVVTESVLVKENSRPVQVTTIPFQNDAGEWLVAQVNVDITNRKRNEAALKKYSEHLEEMVEERTKQFQKDVRLTALGEMATMIGHDLRNPLQIIISMVYLVKEMLTSADIPPLDGRLSVTEILDDIEKSSVYMNKIVSDLQSYAGSPNLEFAETDIHKLISYALSILEIPKGVEVSIEVESGLSEITIDPEMIKRVIVNLVNNSIQSMPTGGQITITITRKGESVVLTVKDEGVGISNENIPKIFLPLFTTKAKGIGLGLAICKRLVEAHKGNIVVTSKVNAGTEVTIEIPQAEKTWTRS
jgi:PAS domain S-box-containing protein